MKRFGLLVLALVVSLFTLGNAEAGGVRGRAFTFGAGADCGASLNAVGVCGSVVAVQAPTYAAVQQFAVQRFAVPSVAVVNAGYRAVHTGFRAFAPVRIRPPRVAVVVGKVRTRGAVIVRGGRGGSKAALVRGAVRGRRR